MTVRKFGKYLRHKASVKAKVESCIPMLHRFAHRTHTGLMPSEQRFVDAEDIAQDLAVIAIKSAEHHTEERGTKFSTYLYRQLLRRAAGRVTRGRDKFGRQDVSLSDRTGAEDDRTVEDTLAVEDVRFLDADKANAFLAVCREVSQEARTVMVRGFLFGDTRNSTPELCAEIGRAAVKVKVGVNDLTGIERDETLRRFLLQSVSYETILSMRTESELRCLECVRCEGQFTVAAIREGRFYVSNMLCRVCLKQMQELPESVSCFGKLYAPEVSTPCRIHCPDKEACRQFTERDEDKMKHATKPAKSAGKKAVKKATEAKVSKKAAAEDDEVEMPYKFEDVPKEVHKWPYRAGSALLYTFMKLLKGPCKASELEKEANEAGASYAGLMRSMRKPHHKNHNWELKEDGGFLRIVNVKYHGAHDKGLERPAKVAKAPKAAKEKVVKIDKKKEKVPAKAKGAVAAKKKKAA